MRVIAGSLGGRRFTDTGGNKTHPMSDKMRGALFNMLGNIEGLTVLDAFAGSGALGFEAASRGAASVTAIESDRAAQRSITANIAALQLNEQVHLVKTTTNAWLNTSDTCFDIVMIDPPYENLQLAQISLLATRINPSGLVALSFPAQQTPPELDNLTLYKHKTYAGGSLCLYEQSTL